MLRPLANLPICISIDICGHLGFVDIPSPLWERGRPARVFPSTSRPQGARYFVLRPDAHFPPLRSRGGGCYVAGRSRNQDMATSSITANFHTDDPMAVRPPAQSLP